MRVNTDLTHPSGVNYELTKEEFDAGQTAVVITGSIFGAISVSDGTVYDISPTAIAVKPEHLAEVHLEIHKKHRAEGRYLDVPLPQ